MNPKVSVIIPTYNRVKYISRAIDSVLNQTYDNIEVIVVDDNNENSSVRDEMTKVMSTYNNSVIYIKHKKNMNGACARNTGIKHASGDYITFLDDDDYYFKTRIEKLVNKIEKEKCDAIYSAALIVKNSKIYSLKNAIMSGNLQLEVLKQQSFFATGSNLFFTAKCLNELKGFDESFFRHQDLELMVRFFRNYNICALDEILVVKNVDDRSNELGLDKSIKYRFYFLDRYKEDISKYNINIQKDIYRENIVRLILLILKCNDKKKYCELFKVLKQHNIRLSVKDRMKIFLMKINVFSILEKIVIKLNLFKKNNISPDILNYVNLIENKK